MADSGYCSRRKAEELIEQGLVKVGGRTAKIGDKVEMNALITVSGERINNTEKRRFYYIMLNKPRGYITSLSDVQDRRCVIDLVKGIPARLFPVGRLDRNSEGLLLLTNDGDFANDITHPSRHVTKTYRVSVHPAITENQMDLLAESIEIDGRMTVPATIYVKEKTPDSSVVVITIKEGRNRQVRRLCEHAGLTVGRLRRTGIGPLKLGMLKPGEFRELTKDELRAIRTAITVKNRA